MTFSMQEKMISLNCFGWRFLLNSEFLLTRHYSSLCLLDSFRVFYSRCHCPTQVIITSHLNYCRNKSTHLPDSQGFIFLYLSSGLCFKVALIICFQKFPCSYRRNVSHCSICSWSHTFSRTSIHQTVPIKSVHTLQLKHIPTLSLPLYRSQTAFSTL